MRRTYFLVPDVEVTQKIVDELLHLGIDQHYLHVLAKRDTPLANLPEASFLQRSDFLPALEQGLALGAVTGMLAGLVAIALPTGLVLGGGAVFAIGAAGAGMGGLMSSMIGISMDNRRIEQFQTAIEEGAILVMVDSDRERVGEIEAIIQKHYPQAEYAGLDSHTFP